MSEEKQACDGNRRLGTRTSLQECRSLDSLKGICDTMYFFFL